jgi:hypothetical protein
MNTVVHAHEPTPDRTGKCIHCGWEVYSDKVDPETPAPEPFQVIDQDYLDSMHPGKAVLDSQGDVWTRRVDGRWKWGAATVTTETLYHIFSPIRMYPEEGL